MPVYASYRYRCCGFLASFFFVFRTFGLDLDFTGRMLRGIVPLLSC
jgi:hypothetical protein